MSSVGSSYGDGVERDKAESWIDGSESSLGNCCAADDVEGPEGLLDSGIDSFIVEVCIVKKRLEMSMEVLTDGYMLIISPPAQWKCDLSFTLPSSCPCCDCLWRENPNSTTEEEEKKE